jgi:hypothetical protein
MALLAENLQANAPGDWYCIETQRRISSIASNLRVGCAYFERIESVGLKISR